MMAESRRYEMVDQSHLSKEKKDDLKAQLIHTMVKIKTEFDDAINSTIAKRKTYIAQYGDLSSSDSSNESS